MRQVRRWLMGLGAVTAVGASLLGQSGTATAGTAAPARLAAPAAAVAIRDTGPAFIPAHRVLKPGMTGGDVRRVQARLRFLHYYPGKVDGQFGQDTVEAVWAFKEVQGLGLTKNPDNIGQSMENRLAHPFAPKPLTRHHAKNRIDVNLGGGYLVLYRHGQVRLISHISSGGGYYFCDPPPLEHDCSTAITPTGNYTALSYLPGNVTVPLGAMFDPVFFIGRAYAIHGDGFVPLYPASHGCVRIPNDTATFFHTLFKIPGTLIFVRRH
jgi:Putative peptidoglycan binding domain/L,D-transpeptidase catalytic domain